MRRATDHKIILVVRRTRLDDLVARFNTVDQARFYLEHLGADFSDYRREDLTYKAAAREAEAALAALGRVHVIDRSFLPNFLFGPHDTIVALGQDGLVANVLKYLEGQPLVGVNPDPARWEGVLLPFEVRDLAHVLPDVFAERRPVREVTMAEARLNTGEVLRGVNDLFIGPRTHTSARYEIEFGGRREMQSSSGIIVSTGLGSTGWLRSIVGGAAGITAAVVEAITARAPARKHVDDSRGGSREAPALPSAPVVLEFPWEAPTLYFSVREPWPSRTSEAGIVFGCVTPSTPLEVVSQMPEHGVIFSDGIEADFVRFNAGTRATISLSSLRGRLAV